MVIPTDCDTRPPAGTDPDPSGSTCSAVLPPATRPPAARPAASTGTLPALAGLLDHLDQGVLLIDSTCRVVHANTPAQSALDAQTVLCRDGERIHPVKVTDRLMWRHTIEDALRGQARLFDTNVQGTRHLVSISPFEWQGNEPYQRHLVVLLGPALAPHPGRLDSFADHCDLTRAERRVFLTLLDDLSPKDIALRLEVAPATVRTHIRRILQKSGSPSMRSLLALITRLPPSRPGI